MQKKFGSYQNNFIKKSSTEVTLNEYNQKEKGLFENFRSIEFQRTDETYNKSNIKNQKQSEELSSYKMKNYFDFKSNQKKYSYIKYK